jgi:HMG-box domain
VPVSKPKPVSDIKVTKPKKPLSAYLLFAQEKRADLPKGLTVCEQMKQIAEKWRSLPATTKATYEQRAKNDKSRYEIECSRIP